jgi:hypothetical protein
VYQDTRNNQKYRTVLYNLLRTCMCPSLDGFVSLTLPIDIHEDNSTTDNESIVIKFQLSITVLEKIFCLRRSIYTVFKRYYDLPHCVRSSSEYQAIQNNIVQQRMTALMALTRFKHESIDDVTIDLNNYHYILPYALKKAVFTLTMLMYCPESKLYQMSIDILILIVAAFTVW